VLAPELRFYRCKSDGQNGLMINDGGFRRASSGFDA
jgi:hypothetical protein